MLEEALIGFLVGCFFGISPGPIAVWSVHLRAEVGWREAIFPPLGVFVGDVLIATGLFIGVDLLLLYIPEWVILFLQDPTVQGLLLCSIGGFLLWHLFRRERMARLRPPRSLALNLRRFLTAFGSTVGQVGNWAALTAVFGYLEFYGDGATIPLLISYGFGVIVAFIGTIEFLYRIGVHTSKKLINGLTVVVSVTCMVYGLGLVFRIIDLYAFSS